MLFSDLANRFVLMPLMNMIEALRSLNPSLHLNQLMTLLYSMSFFSATIGNSFVVKVVVSMHAHTLSTGKCKRCEGAFSTF